VSKELCEIPNRLVICPYIYFLKHTKMKLIQNHIYYLFIVKIALLVWGLLGFVEYFFPTISFGLQEPNFPAGTQFLHWFLITLTGSTFVYGFLRRWKYTPFVTITMYVALATMCFIQTVDFHAFGGGATRFFIMSAEFVLYFLLTIYLLRSKRVLAYFRRS